MSLRLGDEQFAREIYRDIRDQAIHAAERWYDVEVRVRLSSALERSCQRHSCVRRDRGMGLHHSAFGTDPALRLCLRPRRVLRPTRRCSGHVDMADGKADLDGIYNRFDAVMAELDVIKAEQVAQSVELDRHERWHHETAEHVGLTLSHEA